MYYKTTLTIIILIVVLNISHIPLFAYTLINRGELQLDETLSDDSVRQYAFPEKVLITRVQSPVENISVDSEEWISLLHYYFVTRLGFVDLPFNYLIDRQGNVYEARSNSNGVVPELKEIEGAIMIGYLSNSSDITAPASVAFEELVTELSQKYGIVESEISTVDIEVVPPTEGEVLAKLEYKDLGQSLFSTGMKNILSGISYSETDNLTFSAEISEVTAVPSVQLGEKFEVKVSITNVGNEPWFTFNDFIYVVTASGNDSEFAVNLEWDAFDTPTHIEGETILPGDSVDVTFNMNANILPGNYSETFVFSRIGDKKLAGTEFSVNFEVVAGDKQLIEVLPTETGSLNVRLDPNFNAEAIAQVAVGEKFIMLDFIDGWYKIAYNGTDEGWVSGQYIKRL